MTAPLILIDGSAYLYRAFHALPPLSSSKGQPTGAIYGVANMVKRLLKDYKPTQIAVIFDAKGKTFREDWYPDYKAHRPPTPDDLASQFPPLLDLLEAMGLPLFMVGGVEADDVIGTLACMAMAKKTPVLISTSDKDFAQLVNEQVTLINTMTNQALDEQGVKEKFGVYPSQITDYLSLIGDSVDNVPGVAKCGPKTAAKWIADYQSLDALMEASADIGGKIGENLRASLELLPLFKRLVTIKTDVKLPFSLEDLTLRPADSKRLIALVRQLEFKGWLKELLEQTQPEEPVKAAVPVTLVTDSKELEKLLRKIQALSTRLFFDTITTPERTLIGLSLAIEADQAYYIPFTEPKSLDKDQVLTALKPFFENPNLPKGGAHLKVSYQDLKEEGISLKAIAFDCTLASYVLNSTSGQHNNDSLALKYLGYKSAQLDTKERIETISPEKIGAFTAAELDTCMQLEKALDPLLDLSLKKVLTEIELPLMPVLAEMERKGVLIDLPALNSHGLRLKDRIKTLEKEAVELAGHPFNLNSPKQLQLILFEEQKLPIISKTPGGQPSTAESVLQELAYDYPLPALIMEFRGLSKLVSTYIEALPKCINPRSGRVHTSYNQTVTATGRLSSSNPNLQNIPIRSEEGRLIRQAFIAPPQYQLVAADYSQIELHIMAHLSEDENLLKAFERGWDIHKATASEIFQVSIEQVTSEQRRRAKAVNFGLIYGMSPFGLSKQLGIAREDAHLYMDRYFQRYPGVARYMERTRQQAHQQGYVETLFGRRLYLPEINVANQQRRKAAERAAINAPMQGTAADIIKKAMIALADWQESLHGDLSMIMQVHDELIFEVKESILETATAEIKRIMEQVVPLSAPLKVSIGVGANWDQAH